VLPPPERLRAAPGEGMVSFRFLLPQALKDEVAAAAEKEGLEASEWWRRAAVERLTRQKKASRPGSRARGGA
jgi:hypothetical protein